MTGVLVGVLSLGEGSAQADSQEVRSGKRSPVSIRLAISSPAQGHEAVAFGDRTLYLVPRATLAGSKVVSAEAITTRSGSDIVLTLTDDGVDWLSSAISKHKADHVAIFAGRKPLGNAKLSFDAAEGSLKLVGLSGEQAERLVRVLNRSAVAPAGATFTVVPDRTTILPGETVNVHVFLSGASQIRSYQVKVAIRGGSTGALLIDNLWIDAERADYVFGTLQKLDAVDPSNSRMAGVLMQGGVDAVNPAYVGSYSLRASADASGVFNVNLGLDENDSILLRADNQSMPFEAGPAAVITVAMPTNPQPTDE